jgi:DNA-binding transcriptional MocR family regulator
MKKDYLPYGIYAHPGIANKGQYIADCIAQSIKSVRIPPNEKLASLSKLSRELGVNAKTIARSYEILQKAGWIEIRERTGCYVVSHPPSIPLHHLPLFAESGLSMPPAVTDYETHSLNGYANFATIGSESANPASLFLAKQSPMLKALDETTSISAKKWEEHVMEEQDWADECRYVLELKRGMQIDRSRFAVGKGRDNIRLLTARLLINPGAGVILSCFTERAVVNSLLNAQATLFFLRPGLQGLKSMEVKEKCKAYLGTAKQIELLYTNPNREYNCNLTDAISAMTLLMNTASEEKLNVLEEYDGDIPKEIALPPLSIMATPPVNNIVNINAYSTLDPGLQDIRLIAGPASFIQALNSSLLFNNSPHSVIDKRLALLLARKSTLLNFALDYEQRLYQWRTSMVDAAGNYLADNFDIQLPVGGTGLWLKSKNRKEFPIDLTSMQELGVPVAHSRQEISNFCTATALRVGIGWGNTALLKKCLMLMKTFVLA